MGGYTALYRKFRPMTFSEVVGQEHITRTLKNQIITNRVGHAYLFNGGRGTGKTSSAKILARAINCLNPKDGEPCNECEICKAALNGSLTDIVEMDAASNNSVEDIRSIREEVNFLPTKAKYRVYIIDEVHMLSTGAFNALLKTLEEPPEHVKFILATTEPQKLPATILSRCQRFDFKRISNDDIKKRLKIVCEESKINITEGALNIIAILSDGAMRDALSILERCNQDTDTIDEDKVKDLAGIPKTIYVSSIVKNILEYNVEGTIQSIDNILNEGKDLENFVWEILKYVKDMLVYKSSKKAELYSEEEIKEMDDMLNGVSSERLVNLIYSLSEIQNNMKLTTQKSILFQAGMIKLCYNNESSKDSSIGTDSNLEKRIEKIENYLKSNGNRNIETNIIKPSYISNNIEAKPKRVASEEKSNDVKSKINENNKVSYKGKIEDSWPKIVNDLKQNGKIVLFSNLMDTKATQLNDMTVGIQFPKGINAFGKTILEKQENIHELTRLVSIACGKQMNIKYIDTSTSNVVENSVENDIKNLVNDSDISFNITD